MTRFTDNHNQRIASLTKQDIASLTEYLASFLRRNQSRLQEEVDRFRGEYRDYVVRELSDDIVIILTSSNRPGLTFNIGYPFPVYVIADTNEYFSFLQPFREVDVKISVRGNILRDKQRKMLEMSLQDKFEEVTWQSVPSLEDFRKETNHILSESKVNHKPWVYIDNYVFLGDSLTGLYFIDSFQNQYMPEEVRIVSKASRHLNSFYKSFPKDKQTLSEIMNDSEIFIIADLLDNHFSDTLFFLKQNKNKRYIILLLSRNLIIRVVGNKCLVFHYEREDVLLRNKNIEDYMDECLWPFLAMSRKQYNLKSDNKEKGSKKIKIFINPHSSTILKQIPLSLVLDIVVNVSEVIGASFYISKGVDEDHHQWIRSFCRKLEDERFKKYADSITILSDSGLDDLGSQLENIAVSAALTADTAVSHLLSRLMIPNLTVYNEGFWDGESLQSLSAESPLGFCRYYCPQYPVIFTKNIDCSFAISLSEALISLSRKDKLSLNTKRIIEVLMKRIEGIKKIRGIKKTVSYHNSLYDDYHDMKNHVGKDMSWLFKIYNPEAQISRVKMRAESSWLIYSAWKNLPFLKYGMFLSEDRNRIKKPPA